MRQETDRELTFAENSWLDRLEKKLARSPQQELEAYIHNHPAERIPQLRALAEQLVSAGVLCDEVRADRDHIVDRWRRYSDTDQVDVLQDTYAEVRGEYARCQRPEDLEPRLTAVAERLAGVEREAADAEQDTAEPERIQQQMDRCLHLYQLLSELKPEVEYVIRTGRKAVEDAAWDQPEQLTARLDRLKALYNQLRRRLDRVRADWRSLQGRLASRTRHVQEKKAESEAQLSDFEADLNDLEKWLQHADKDTESDEKVEELERQLPERQSQLAAARQTAAQLALTQCEQSVSSMMSELNARWLQVHDKVQESSRATSNASKHAPTKPSRERSEYQSLDATPPESSSVIANSFAMSARGGSPARRASAERGRSPGQAEGDVFANKYATEGPPAGRRRTPERDEVPAYVAELDAVIARIDAVEAGMERQPRVAARRHSEIEAAQLQVSLLQPDVATLISRGDTLVYSLHGRDVARADALRRKVDGLRGRWHALKSYMEVRRLTYQRLDSISRHCKQQLEDIERWLLQVNARLEAANNDLAQQKALQEEIGERGVELESVRWEAADLTGQDRDKLATILDDLSQRWKAAQDRCKQYQKVMEAKAIDGQAALSPAAAFAGRVSAVREAVATVQRQLASAPIGVRQYERFNAREEALKSIRGAMDALEPRVDEQLTDLASLTSADTAQRQMAQRAADKLRDDWRQLQQGYQERHSNWCRCRDTWRALQENMHEFGQWLVTAEARITETRRLGTAQLPQLRACQKELEKQVTVKHNVYTAISSASREVIGGLSAAEATTFLEKIENLNKRWKGVLAELAARRERISTMEDEQEAHTQTAALLGWTESVLTLTQQQLNPSDEGALIVNSSVAKSRLEELPDKKALAEKLSWPERQFRPLDQLSKISANLERVGDTLPGYAVPSAAAAVGGAAALPGPDRAQRLVSAPHQRGGRLGHRQAYRPAAATGGRPGREAAGVARRS
ncbi:dystrophin-like [Pollicipes pollicipes]|uniref:dystrophin-like n=1 Tax=Pollicipes pollicipes TaxID=41117 RepID=UPI0018852117|nr:dystrophin-like [Pollicipes pollicipes]